MNTLSIEKQILYLDEHLIAVNKPAGLRVIPDGYDTSLPNLRDMLNELYPKIWVIHRIDKDTSGILIFARDTNTHRALNQQFEKRTVKKQYHLIVTGKPPWTQTTIKFPLRVNGDRKHRTVVDFQKGKPAETEFTVQEVFSEHSFLFAHPHSGYTHQIRAHISAAGFPIPGDLLYWKAAAHISEQTPPTSKRPLQLSSPPSLERLALHAAQITFFDVNKDKYTTFSANYPADLSGFLLKLRNSP